MIDATLADPGVLFMLHVSNYADGNGEALREMLLHPATVLGLADGGAHVATICDASMPTDHAHPLGPRPLTRRTAPARVRGPAPDRPKPLGSTGCTDRGVIAPGMLADLNVIDFDRLAVRRPEVVHDLPGGARRLVQRRRRVRRHA